MLRRLTLDFATHGIFPLFSVSRQIGTTAVYDVKVIVPRRNWTRLTDMVDELHRKFSSAAYVFRNDYFFLDLPDAPHETSNITFLRHRLKVSEHWRLANYEKLIR